MSLLSLLGCAAQTSYGLYQDAQARLEKAKSVDPRDPKTLRAESEFSSGREAMKEGRYGKAEHSFISSMSLADQVVNREQIEAAKAEQLRAQIESQPVTPPTPEQLAEVAKQEVKQTQEKIDRTSLPREALAKYLADKRRAGSSAPKPLPATPTPQGPEVRSGGNSAKTPVEITQNSVTSVEDSAAQPPPPSSPEPLPQQPTQISPTIIRPLDESLGGAEPIELEPLKRTLRGRLSFDPNSSKLSDASMSQLDSMAQFLIENPSNSLLVVNVLGSNEAEGLLGERFQEVSGYLKARGVPEDQIRMDNIKKSGSVASLELYLIDH